MLREIATDPFKGKFDADVARLVGAGRAIAGSIMGLVGKLNLAFSSLVTLAIETKWITDISSCLQDCDFHTNFSPQFSIKLTEDWSLSVRRSYSIRVTSLRVDQFILH